MIKFALLSGIITMFFSVALGAFGAHGLKSMVSANLLDTWATSMRYMAMHAMALIALAISQTSWPLSDTAMRNITMAFVIGIIIFSGSLILRVLLNQPWWGRITPIGGLFLLAGWLLWAVEIWKMQTN